MTYSTRSTWRGRLIRYAPIVFWAGVILFLGSGQGSMSQTSRFIRPIIEFFFPSASPETVLLIHGLIRKAAHYVEYAILAFFSARALCGSSRIVFSRYWYALSMLIVLLVSAIDESIQSTNPARTGALSDVLLDLFGGVSAIVIFWFVHRPRRSSV
jgi:VanZ family protein